MSPGIGPMCKGAIFRVNASYIRKICGEDGFQKVISAVGKKWPHFNVDSMKEKDWFPLEMRIAFLEACRSELGWDDKRIYLMGSDAAQHSSIIMSFISYFLTVNKAIGYAPEMWGHNYNTGKLEILENQKGSGKLILTDFKHSPILCTYLAGYFHGVGATVAKAADVKVTEEKCVHKGAEHCVFAFKWDE
jgi:predicted hydrocarbon binding protein